MLRVEVALHLLPPIHVIDPAAPEVALHQVEIPPNGLARLAVKVTESHGRPVLIERQTTDRAGLEWRPVSSLFRV